MVLPVTPQDRIGNKLLAALPSEEYKHILPYLEPISFSFGESIYESSEQPNYAYFPTTSIASLVYVMKEIIVCKRGFITILDKAALEVTACECYRVIKEEYDRLLDLGTSLSLPSIYTIPRR